MKAIDPNYEPPEQTFNSFPDGKYKVKGFNWFSVNDKQLPILVAQRDGKLVGRFYWTLLDSSQGPPMSVTLSDMPLLAKALKVTVTNPPDPTQAGLVTRYMLDFANACKDKEVEVEVSKGWVNTVPGMDVPEGYFYFYLSDITSPDHEPNGDPKPKQGQYGSFFFLTFAVEAGEGGSESPYKGATFTELVNYAITNDNGKLDFQRTKEGNYNYSSVIMSKAMRLTAPEPFAGEFDPPNKDNLLPYWKQTALPQRKMLKGSRAKEQKSGRIGLVWSTVEEAIGYKVSERILDKLDVNIKCRQILVEALNSISPDPVVKPGTFELTETGIVVARSHLSPLKAEGLIQHGFIGELTPDEINIILSKLTESGVINNPSFKNRAAAEALGFTAPPQEEIVDTPF